MSNVFFTSDTHFGHAKLAKYCPKTRGFGTVEQVDDTIVALWNDVVCEDDVVFHLGDLAFAGPEYTCSLLDKMKGTKVLVTGNHDVDLSEEVRRKFANIYDAYTEVHIMDQMFVLCHYPIASWNMMGKGSVHLHGHLHGKPSGVTGRAKDVGVDTHNLKPYSIREIMDWAHNTKVRKF